jgi:hypothetical protein
MNLWSRMWTHDIWSPLNNIGNQPRNWGYLLPQILFAKKAETQRDKALEEIKIDSTCADLPGRQITSSDQRGLFPPSEFITVRTCNACSWMNAREQRERPEAQLHSRSGSENFDNIDTRALVPVRLASPNLLDSISLHLCDFQLIQTIRMAWSMWCFIQQEQRQNNGLGSAPNDGNVPKRDHSSHNLRDWRKHVFSWRGSY